MKVIVIRHGHALEREISEGKLMPDDLRPLTEEGIKKIKNLAQFLRENFSEIRTIISSPLKRAKETAELVNKEYKEAKIIFSDNLKPECHAADIYSVLEKQKNDDTIIVVGHEPILSSFISLSISGNEYSQIFLRKSGCAVLNFMGSFAPHKAYLEWLLSSKVIKG